MCRCRAARPLNPWRDSGWPKRWAATVQRSRYDANRAGGHDNITVIVAEFDGPALSDPAPGQLISYQKYPLPEAPVDTTVRAVALQPESHLPPVSEEARGESRRLRVGHTMVGMTSPLGGASPSGSPGPNKPSSQPGLFTLDNEPVSIPTSGLAPSLVGILVLGSMLVVALVGYLLVR